jgi:hypothetical protein
MPTWLQRLRRSGSSRGVMPLAQQLRAYPPYSAPHPGPPERLTPAQAQQNLDHLLAEREHRLQTLGALLAHWGIDIAPALAGADAKPLLAALHRWTCDEWPALHDPALARRDRWLRSTRSGAEIVYSLLMDFALLLGELIVRRRPSYRWAIDTDEVSGRDAIASYLRPVLQAPQQDDMPAPVTVDVEEIVVNVYWWPGHSGVTLLNPWARVFDNAVSGAREAARPTGPEPHEA